MGDSMIRRWMLGLPLLLALGQSACDRSDGVLDARPTVCPTVPSASGQVIDRALVAFLSKAKAVHHKVDLLLSDVGAGGSSVEDAIAALQQLVAGPRPTGSIAGDSTPPIEVREVLADSRARLAGLLSEHAKHDAAEAQLRRGLSELPERNLYRGRLMEMLGVVEEARYRQLLAAGEKEQAKRAKARAVSAFGQAISLHDEVIRALLATPKQAP
jgi:hypothetical protein